MAKTINTSRRPENGPFSDEQWWKMCDVHLDLPVKLFVADLKKPFIYDRKWGVFYCPPGYHTAAMGLLLAFHEGQLCRLTVAAKFGGVDYVADHYLEHTPGTAFRSSVGTRLVRTWGKDSLNAFEKRFFDPLEFINPVEARNRV